MSNLNNVLKQILQLQSKTINTIKQTTIVKEVQNDNYTAFEVCPHNSFIKKGTKIVNSPLANAKNVKQYLESLESDEERQNAIIDYNIEASMIHEFTLRSEQLPDDIDVIIDWGDGTTSKCSSDYIGTDNIVGGVLGGSRGDYRYKMQHEYTSEGIFTVKIYGKNYFAIIPNKQHNNITCSIFREDLPIASHLSNFSSFSYGAKMLLYVNIFNCGFNNQVLNAANLFYYCLNLKKAVGFNSYTNMKHCGGIFGHCYALKYTDFKFPSFSLLGDYRESFYKCWALSNNIEDLFPTIGFIGNKSILMNSTFYECKALKGTIPDYKLWNDKKIIFEQINNCFINCSDEIRAQAPVSWGGTNTSIDAQLAITDKMKNDYTAYQVYPNSVDLPVGSTVIGSAVWNDEKLTVNTIKIPACSTEEFSLWITKKRPETDIIIDWGDGVVEKLSELKYTPVSGTMTIPQPGLSKLTADPKDSQTDVVVYVAHTYAIPDKVYTIKIYGKDYCRLSHNICKISGNNRLMVRALSDDLPIASHLNNLASFCYGSRRLLKVEMPSYSKLFNQVTNWSSCFNTCQNLISCTGWCLSKTVMAYNALFQYCDALEKTDFFIGRMSYSSLQTVFDRCQNLTVDILSLISQKISSGVAEVDVNNLFQNCKKLSLGTTTELDDKGNSITIPITQEYYNRFANDAAKMEQLDKSLDAAAKKLAARLWNDRSIVWKNTLKCFNGATNIIRKYAPISWGGTASDNIIEKSLQEKLNISNQAITALEARIAELETKLS